MRRKMLMNRFLKIGFLDFVHFEFFAVFLFVRIQRPDTGPQGNIQRLNVIFTALMILI